MSVIHIDPLTREAQETLKEALEMKFRTVLVLGIDDDGVHMRRSSDVSTIELIGMLEALKLHVYEHWEDV